MREGFWLTGDRRLRLLEPLHVARAPSARKALGNPASWGLDAAVPAAFLGLVWPRLQTNFLRVVAVVSMVFALLVTPWLPAGLPIIATTVVAVGLGWRAR